MARTSEASLFRLEPSRATWVAQAMLGEDFIGVLCMEFYGVYTAREDWTHAYFGAHLIREVKKIAEVSPSVPLERPRATIGLRGQLTIAFDGNSGDSPSGRGE